MFIHELHLKNIGPFKNEGIKFIRNDNEQNTITIITGQNGSGKSIIIDAIRGLLASVFSNSYLKRSIVSNEKDFSLSMKINFGSGLFEIEAHQYYDAGKVQSEESKAFDVKTVSEKKITASLPYHIHSQLDTIKFPIKWIIDYWTSQITIDKFKLDSISKLDVNSYLKEGLLGIQNNLNVIKLITFFDYLSGSADSSEKELGNTLFELVKNLINESLNYGEFSHISRTTLQPVLKIRNQDITLDKLSSGNIYLIQRLLSLVYKAYSAFTIYGGDPKEIHLVKGLLLIDEIENHLHPKWQKKILRIIRKYFPNLQIIVTTHSPFIISSIDNINVFVCQMKDVSAIINDQTDYYKNMPIEEIIRTPLFSTDSFNEEISDLIQKRKVAIENSNDKLANEIEAILIEKNPGYFRYFKIDDI